MGEGQGIVTFKAHGGKRMFEQRDMKGRIDHHIYGLASWSITHPKKCHWCHSLQAWGANWCSCSWTQRFCWQKKLRWCWSGIQRSCRWSEGRCSRRPGSPHEHKAVPEWRGHCGFGVFVRAGRIWETPCNSWPRGSGGEQLEYQHCNLVISHLKTKSTLYPQPEPETSGLHSLFHDICFQLLSILPSHVLFSL